MKRYINLIKDTHTTHQRRQRAVQVAGVLTATLLVVWLGTLGYRLSNQDAIAQSPGTSLTASAAAAVQDMQAQLQVSTTSVYSN